MRNNKLKKTVGILIGILTLVIAVFGTCMSYAEEDGSTYEIPFTKSIPENDGIKESLWYESPVIEIGEDNTCAKIRLLWDKNRVYIFGEVTDKNVCISENIDERNDCLKIKINHKNAESEEFIIFSSYKEEVFGETVNNNYRDYVAAEFRKTEAGYNVEAMVQLKYFIVPGDELDFGAELFNISENNGEITERYALENVRLVLTDKNGLFEKDKNDTDMLSVLMIDMGENFSDEEILKMKELYSPLVVGGIFGTEEEKNSLLKAFEEYESEVFEKSGIVILYDSRILSLKSSGEPDNCNAGCCIFDNTSLNLTYNFVCAKFHEIAKYRYEETKDVIDWLLSKTNSANPTIICCETESGIMSFQDSFLSNMNYKDAEKIVSTVPLGNRGKMKTWVLDENNVSIDNLRYESAEGTEETGAMFLKMVIISRGVNLKGIPRKNKIVLALECILTIGIAGGVSAILLIKSRGKRKKC